MQNATVPLYCPNCQSPNQESNEFCQQCQTRLPKRYLWAVGEAIEGYELGDLLNDRYLLKGSRVVLDVQPGWPVEYPGASEVVEPYLRLFPYRLHVPQVYESLQARASGQSDQEIVLLEQAPIANKDLPETFDPIVTCSAIPLEQAWHGASTLRQLNWLWQMAQLWQPLSGQRVVSSLLQPELLRVEGALFRLLELRLDFDLEPTLAELGQLWLRWIPEAQAEIADPLEMLCQQIIEGQIGTAEHLVNQLDQWLTLAGKSRSYQVEIITRTDPGPSRKANEDACYPPDGDVVTSPALTIVCDGVGGHAGGAIASTTAIEALKEQLQEIQLSTPGDLITELEDAVFIANDRISQRNDSEQRQDRQRMGTTVVMALAKAHELYITHVGDSRAYWITRSGCYQVTLDDDVASREVRLGYMPYRVALAQPTSGALVQALGMGPSAILHPTVQRFVLDEDCIFLLCSDGLSDFDRVEEYWDTEILPILEGKIDLAAASQRLVAIANTQNGHDNVTVSLIHCRVTERTAEGSSEGLQIEPGSNSPTFTQLAKDGVDRSSHREVTRSRSVTPTHPQPRRSRALWLFLLGIFLPLGVGGLGAYLFTRSINRQEAIESSSTPSAIPKIQPSQPPRGSPNPDASSALPLTVNSIVQIRGSAPGASQAQTAPIVLLREPKPPLATRGSVLAGSVLQVTRQQARPGQESWFEVKVCTSSAGAPPSASIPPPVQPLAPSPPLTSPLPPGATGWIQESVITKVALPTAPNQQRLCSTNLAPAGGNT